MASSAFVLSCNSDETEGSEWESTILSLAQAQGPTEQTERMRMKWVDGGLRVNRKTIPGETTRARSRQNDWRWAVGQRDAIDRKGVRGASRVEKERCRRMSNWEDERCLYQSGGTGDGTLYPNWSRFACLSARLPESRNRPQFIRPLDYNKNLTKK